MTDNHAYESGYAESMQQWSGKYAHCHFDYFARHKHGTAICYDFNSRGYRGPEHWTNPDISVFGSSFSFGVGIEYHQCWHQLLGAYRVNCYAAAGFLITNNDIIQHYHDRNINLGMVILQLREFRYNTQDLTIPDAVNCFVIDELVHSHILTLPWSSFVDKAADEVHPGPLTHQSWAKTIKNAFNL